MRQAPICKVTLFNIEGLAKNEVGLHNGCRRPRESGVKSCLPAFAKGRLLLEQEGDRCGLAARGSGIRGKDE